MRKRYSIEFTEEEIMYLSKWIVTLPSCSENYQIELYLRSVRKQIYNGRKNEQ